MLKYFAVFLGRGAARGQLLGDPVSQTVHALPCIRRIVGACRHVGQH